MSLPVQETLIAFAPAPRVPTEALAALVQRPPHIPDPPGPTDIRRDNTTARSSAQPAPPGRDRPG